MSFIDEWLMNKSENDFKTLLKSSKNFLKTLSYLYNVPTLWTHERIFESLLNEMKWKKENFQTHFHYNAACTYQVHFLGIKK